LPVPPPEAAPTPEPWTLDLTGRWQGKVATTLPGPPSRPALREVFVETDRSGNIVAAGVTLTDPSHGGAGAGYLTVPNGRERLNATAAATLASPKGASLALDFIPLPPWTPHRERQWRVVEGQRRTVEDTSYLLLESLESDYLIQAGVNASGFLSYVYLSPDYASASAVSAGKNSRGTDVLSTIIHPASEARCAASQRRVGPLGRRRLREPAGRRDDLGPRGAPDRFCCAGKPPRAAPPGEESPRLPLSRPLEPRPLKSRRRLGDRDHVAAALDVLLHGQEAVALRVLQELEALVAVIGLVEVRLLALHGLLDHGPPDHVVVLALQGLDRVEHEPEDVLLLLGRLSTDGMARVSRTRSS
jgi:hypothetical protein